LKTNVVSKEDCSFGEMVELCKACRSVGAYIDSPRTQARRINLCPRKLDWMDTWRGKATQHFFIPSIARQCGAQNHWHCMAEGTTLQFVV
jgi:hypothetical protein